MYRESSCNQIRGRSLRRLLSIAGVLALAVLSACTLPITPLAKPADGAIEFGFPLDRGLYQDILFWHINAKGPGPELDRTVPAGTPQLLVSGLAVGDWLVRVEGLDNRNQAAYSDTRLVTIVGGANTARFHLSLVDGRQLHRWTFDENTPDRRLHDSMNRLSPLDTAMQGFFASAPVPMTSDYEIDGSGTIDLPDPGASASTSGACVDFGAVRLGQVFSVSCWIKPVLSGAHADRRRVLFSNQDPVAIPVAGESAGAGFSLMLNSYGGGTEDGSVWLSVSDGLMPHTIAFPGVNLVTGHWVLLGLAVDRNAHSASLYLDDVRVSTINYPVDFPSDGKNLRFGAFPAGNGSVPAYFYAGSLDDLRIWAGTWGGAELVGRHYFEGGKGSAAEPYLVATAKQLNAIRFFPQRAFRLVSDIDMAPYHDGQGFTPIGNPGYFEVPFQGSLDGGNHAIRNLWINMSPMNQVGLFGCVNGAAIHDLVLDQAQIHGMNQVGSLIGADNSSTSVLRIERVAIRGASVTASSGSSGLLAGELNNVTINDCTVEGYLSGSTNSGGLAGVVNGGGSGSMVSNCRSQAMVISGSGNNIGGLIGSSNGVVTIRACNSQGSATGPNYVGGLIGYAQGSTRIEDSYSSASVQSYTGSGLGFGGLAGSASYVVERCFATGPVYGGGTSTNVGGLLGQQDSSGTVSYCYAQGLVQGDQRVGGLVGIGSGSISNAYSLGKVLGGSGPTGGVVGDWLGIGMLDYVFATGPLMGGGTQGGIRGSGTGVVSDRSFYDIDGIGWAAPGSPLTHAQAQDATVLASYGTAPHWSFGGPWRIQAGSYPYFEWQGNVNIPWAPQLWYLIAGFGLSGSGGFVSTNTGEVWSSSSPLGSATINAAAISDAAQTMVLGTSTDVRWSRDRGATWYTGGFAEPVQDVAVSIKGSPILTATNGGNLRIGIWNGSSFVFSTFNGPSPPPSSSWSEVVVSENGQVMAAADAGGARQLWLSGDGGNNWSNRGVVAGNIHGLSMSEDGSFLVAGDYDVTGSSPGDGKGGLYYSSNGGLNWQKFPNAPTGSWTSTALSRDGMIIYATAFGVVNPGDGGFIWVSRDRGQSWTTSKADQSLFWRSISCSRDGRLVVAVSGTTSGDSSNNIWVSYDAGQTWQMRDVGTKPTWTAAAIAR